MKTVSTIILAIGGILLVAAYLGIGPRDLDSTAIGVMVFAGVLHLIWGQDETNNGQPG